MAFALYRLPQPALLGRVVLLPLGVCGAAGGAEAPGVVHLIALRLFLMAVPLHHRTVAVAAPVGAPCADVVAVCRLDEVGGDVNLRYGGELVGGVKVAVADDSGLYDVGGGGAAVLVEAGAGGEGLGGAVFKEWAVVAYFERRLDAVVCGLGWVYECSVLGVGAGWLHDIP